jgi:hypothetical protein
MPRGAPAVKLAITVDAEVHAKVARAARREKLSISAWMTEAARQSLRIRDGLAAVAEWEARHGAFTEQELGEARRRIREKHLTRARPRRTRSK